MSHECICGGIFHDPKTCGCWGCREEAMSDEQPKTDFYFYVDARGTHRWRASDAQNNEVLFDSSQGYVDKRDAEKSAKRAGWKPKRLSSILT